jgi:FkbM family methyltransferase
MKKLKFLFSKTLLHHVYEELWLRYYFKFVLPKLREVTLEGVQLDVSMLPLKIRNRIQNSGYEAQEVRMCKEYLRSEDSVLEIGGAIGFVGLVCQRNLGIRNYAVFEANPRTLEILRRNYRLNGLEPRAWNLALASQEGMVELEVGTDFWENSIVPSGDRREGRKIMDVPAGTLDTLLRQAGHPVNVLIIDVEGAEQFIDFSQIPDAINKIIIELHPKVIGVEKTYHIIALLVAKGFRVVSEEGGTFALLRHSAPVPEPNPARIRENHAPMRQSVAQEI